MKTDRNIACFFVLLFLLSIAACNHREYYSDYTNAKGSVVGKEICHSDQAEDYWLIDFDYISNSKRIGDTLRVNGATYTNVLKVKRLAERLKVEGMRVSIDYKTITPEKVMSTNCGVANPITFALKELFILYQGEQR